MTVDDVRKLCPHFEAERKPDGKVKCSHLQADGEMCYLPSHFRCELRIHIEREALAKKGVEPFSISRLGSFDDCPRKYFLTYCAKATAPDFSEAMNLGKVFAECRAKIDTGQPYEVTCDPRVNPAAVVKLRAVLYVYGQCKDLVCPPGVDARQEVEGHWTVKDVLMRGYADRIRGTTIDEWKYTAMGQDNWSRMKVSRQACAYFRAFPECNEFVLWLALKTRHKQGKTETLDAFYKRLVEEEFYPPSKIFAFKTWKRSEFDLETEDDWTSLLVMGIHDCQRMNKWPPRYAACHQGMFECLWLPYCETHQRIGCGMPPRPEHPEITDNTPTCSHPDICAKVIR